MPNQLHTIVVIAKSHINYTTNELAIIFQKDFIELKKKYPKYKTTLDIFAIYAQHITNLSRGMYKLIRDDNLYSSRILLRALIEHAFLIDFLARRSIEEQSDRICKDFIQFCKTWQEKTQLRNADIIYAHPEPGSKPLSPGKLKAKEPLPVDTQKMTDGFSMLELFQYLKTKKDSHVSDIYNKGTEFYMKYYAVYNDLAVIVHGNELLMKEDVSFNNAFDSEFDTLGAIEALIEVHFFACLSIIGFFKHLDKKFEEKILRIIDIQLEFYKKF